MGRSDDKVAAVATVLYLLFLPLYPITASLMGEVTSNAVIAVATVVNVLVTAVYAFFTWRLWRETRAAALTAAEQIRLTRVEQGLRLRPYVAMEVEIEFAGKGPFGFRFNLSNKGPVPAHLRRIEGRAWLDTAEQHLPETARPGEQNLVTFPDTHAIRDWHRVIDGQDGAEIAGGIVTMPGRVRVEYAGVDPTPAEAPTYVSELTFRYDPVAKKPWVEEPTTAT